MSNDVETFGVRVHKGTVNGIQDCVVLRHDTPTTDNVIVLSPAEIVMLKEFFLENRV